ncbi:MAG: filamentous hemagglutinin N-terminal domain-containing protein [Thermomicrobiales bacterium]|nr:MAG: filamentous hemagglutinin N-terminal domain-containing protein [Thermomicrobiales bacterium]
MRFETGRRVTRMAVPLAALIAFVTSIEVLHAQSTNIVATPGAVGTGGLGTSVNTSGNVTSITGGTRPGNGPNVFHSFNQFSVGAGDVASFVNPGGASNVISRVIGGSPSNINGTIQALNWNLFFINPSGVIFGPSAKLNVTGSAYFGTANAILFSDQRVFSANQFAFDNTLSIAAPASFGFLGPSPYGPVVLSPGTVLQSNVVIGLVGGTIQINGSRISAHRIVLGSNAGTGGNVSVEPGVANPFLRVTQGGEIQAAPGTVLETIPGGVIPASVDLLPATITVPSGAQVVTSTNPLTQRVTQIEVTGQGTGGLPPLPVASSLVASPVALANPVDPVAVVNRAATVLPQQQPAAPVTLVTNRCAARKDGLRSSFVQAGRDVTPTPPGAFLASPVVLEDVAAVSAGQTSALQAAGLVPQRMNLLHEVGEGC